MEPLACHRDVIAIDLPGFGETPPLAGPVSVRTLADAVTEYLAREDLLGVDAVGSSMGGRLVLELARRGSALGHVVALDPGGFWQGWERRAFHASIYASVRLLRALDPLLPAITRSELRRSMLLAQFSVRPWRLDPALVLNELRSYARSPSFDVLLHELVYGEPQPAAPRGSIAHPLVIGWGCHDRVCLPRQAARARQLFPDARMHWFADCGHFPHWDRPEETVRLILAATGGWGHRPEIRLVPPPRRAVG
jgi:pimeloyl-ACP methyl ester carboxylesterase